MLVLDELTSCVHWNDLMLSNDRNDLKKKLIVRKKYNQLKTRNKNNTNNNINAMFKAVTYKYKTVSETAGCIN